MLWIKKSFKYQNILVPLFVVLFVFMGNVKAMDGAEVNNGDVIISELMWPGSSLSTADEFIELFNTTDHAINISEWKLSKISSNTEVVMLSMPANSSISAKSYFVVANYNKDNIKSILNIVPDVVNTAVSIANDKLQVALYKGAIEDKSNLVDIAGDGNNPLEGENEAVKRSMERNDIAGDGTVKKNWHTCMVSYNLDVSVLDCATPGAKNSETEKEEPIIEPVPMPDQVADSEKKIYPTNIIITELFPNPFKAQYEEYIELYNGSQEDIDLLGWTLHDGSKSGKHTFAQSVILQSRKYLAVFKKDFKFALNNSGNETVTLSDPNGKEIAKASYDGSKRNVSYNFDGARWRWSKFLTPGLENILNNEPYGTLKIDEDVFKNAYTNFSVSTGDADGDKVKVTWNFGDGHKSYLSKTRHKYLEVGTYEGNVKLSDGSEDVVKTFVVEVKKFPHPKVRIVAVNANPEGSDTLGETLTIENKSKERVNLEGWSIATGSKKLTNHPITEKFVLKKKETKEIGRKISKFSLNNKKVKIELRYPDGEVADKVKYDHGKVSIDEGESYVKEKNGWRWVTTSQKSIKSVKSIKQEEESNQQPVTGNQMQEVNGAVAGAESVKKEYSFVMLENNVLVGKIEFKNSEARVLGTESVREVDGQYFLTAQGKEKQHYAITFFHNVFLATNLKLNTLLNYLN
ncbi:MAG: endonuclease/exonuclease/phosphatase family protein [uncultured bacterium]|nr:MAG: endonuclease/exonuclease/phosphatase family protein [uncultured bacterium]